MSKPTHRAPGLPSLVGPSVALYARPDGTLMPVGWRATTRTAGAVR